MPQSDADAVEVKSFSDLPIWRRVARILSALILFLVVIFLPAGRLDWIDGWLLLVFLFGYTTIFSLWLRRKHPDLWKERTSRASNVESWDKLVIAVYTILSIALYIVAGLDAVRFGWSSVPTVMKVLAWCVLLVATWLVTWAMAENTFASRCVRIQKDREQKVISTGPYRYVRHPMYVGVILFVTSIPLMLGSIWALVPGMLIVGLFFVRTALEDRTLQKGLPGYKEYADQVRYRLIPSVW